VKIFEKVVTVKLRESFTRPLHSSTRTSCTDKLWYTLYHKTHLVILICETIQERKYDQ